MEYTVLGASGIRVSEIGIGCWPIGGPFYNLGLAGGWQSVSETDARAGLQRSLELGANCFDTADVYGFGHSERLLGWMVGSLKSHSTLSRSLLCLMSKVGYFPGTASHGYDPLHMRHQLEMTLKNLRTDYLDVYFFHHLDFGADNELFDEAVETMYSFKRAGKVRFIGLRGPHRYSGKPRPVGGRSIDKFTLFTRIAEAIQPDVVGLRYNMLSPTSDRPETDTFAWCDQRRIGVVIYKPLAQGLLLDKYNPDNPPVFEAGDHRSRKLWFGSNGLTLLRTALTAVKTKFGCRDSNDLARLAIAFCRSRSDNACTLVGFRNARQVEECLRPRQKLTVEECTWLRGQFSTVIEDAGNFSKNM